MKTALIKIMIGLLPTAVATDAVQYIEPNENTDDSVTIESIIKDYDGKYPMIYNIDETNVKVGDNFDPLAGVYAVDSSDDLTENIEVKGDVDTNTEGDYYLNYKVTGNDGSWYEETRHVTVSEDETSEIKNAPGSDNVDRVTFKNVKDVTVSKDEKFDPKKDITIIDTDGHDITEDVYIVGDKVDTSKKGKYYIAYTVIDRFGEANAKAVTVTVK